MSNHTDEEWLQRLHEGIDLTPDIDAALAVIAAADELVRYLSMCKAVDLIERSSNPANAANVRDKIEVYVKARGKGL